jgi:hypothetical protein
MGIVHTKQAVRRATNKLLYRKAILVFAKVADN